MTPRPENTPSPRMGESEIVSLELSQEVDFRQVRRIIYTERDRAYYDRLAHNRRAERRRKAQSALIPIGELIDPALLAMFRRRDGE